ncbi:MAG: molybdenum ABC transporter ATP-binding protein [Candidatus Saccharibacteria bacterium]|nr:molybdenum ABC transporter ATP-binding protein [Pseudorhodobacter sp.]
MTLSVRLTHRFPGFTLDVAFDAAVGVTALFGRSGSGKTTVVNAVAGLLRPDQGLITARGVTLFDGRINLPPHRRRIGYVFQEARLFPHLTVRSNLKYGAFFARTSADYDQIVTLLGIETLLNRRPAALSGGEKQRVAIGRALLSDPMILLMDEPFAALDDARKAEIMPYIERLRDRAIPILYVSHSVAEITRIAHSVVVLDRGSVLQQGPVAQVFADPALAPHLGPREAGSLLQARIAAQDADGLTRLDTACGPIWLPRIDAPLGTPVRIRIAAQDVLLSRTRPDGLSALNILPATVATVTQSDAASALVQLHLGPDLLLARITRRSAEALTLKPGTPVFAILKSVAIAPGYIGGA